MGKLTALKVRSLSSEGRLARHADGGNLYLAVTGKGHAKWTLRYMIAGNAREMGLGAYSATGDGGRTLAEARDAAECARRLLKSGIDPVEHQKEATLPKTVRTFNAVAEEYVSAHEAGWKNTIHRNQWRSTLSTYAYSIIGSTPIEKIDTDSVLKCLQPIWSTKTETAGRVRGRIERILSYAIARGWREGPNPALWRGHLDTMLPKRSKIAPVVNHSALPWPEIASFMSALRKHRSTSARALEFTILNASRTGEVLGARWCETDLTKATWTIPASRMKAGKEHRVPLSNASLSILNEMALQRCDNGDGYVFPGQKPNKPLSQMAMEMQLRRMKRRDITVHGFRSAFRDWCSETTNSPTAVAEAALAHTIGDKVEAAYRRGDLFDKRRELMREWADYCATPAEGQPAG